MERMKGAVKRTFFAGLVVVIPILITAFALYWLFRLLDGFLSPFIHEVAGREIPGLGILIEIVVIFLVGVVATNVLGSRILNWFQTLLMHTPVVKNIYPTIKQLVEAFHPSSSSSFKKVVLVEYPKMGTFAVGFLTSEVALKGDPRNQRLYSVYIPTNNLYLGNVALFKEEDLIVTDFTVEEGLKIVLSGGTAFPPAISRPNRTQLP
ncbi:MAG: hypothetical protein AMJ94_19760 [Deltaproteobacteria bacterium SM23_61]|nr:MAG: hypothetical protein AMJ94_19760 [Deltaproteobacteria bacterium SM23_61]